MLMQKLDTTDDTYRMDSDVICTPRSCQVKDDFSFIFLALCRHLHRSAMSLTFVTRRRRHSK